MLVVPVPGATVVLVPGATVVVSEPGGTFEGTLVVESELEPHPLRVTAMAAEAARVDITEQQRMADEKKIE